MSDERSHDDRFSGGSSTENLSSSLAPAAQRRRASPLSRTTLYVTIEDAAAMLATTPVALRARCRRAARCERGRILADLGDRIIAVKIGRSWRVRFPDDVK
jgi:hypothetical protein